MKRTNDSNGQSHVHGGGGDGSGNIGGEGGAALQNLTNSYAISYLKSVKQMFHDQGEKYDMFLAVMKDFQVQKIDTAGVRARVKELFKGHNDLISGFNNFLPEGYEIMPDEDEAPQQKMVDYNEALDFVHKIRKRFQNDELVYKSFLDTLNVFRKESKDIREICTEVSSLFGNHPDLLKEFTRFLPNTSAIPSIQHAQYDRNLSQHFNDQSSTAAIKQQMQLDKQHHRRDKLITSQDRNLSVHRSELDDGKAMIKVHKEQKKHAEEIRERSIHDRNERVSDLCNNKGLNLQCVPDKKKSAKKVEGLGLTANFPSCDNKDTLKGMYDQAFSFSEKVKARLGSSDDHQAFLRCLHMFSSGIIKRHDLNDMVISLLGKYPDLMDEFNDFLDQCENIDGFLANVISKIPESLCSDGQLAKSSKLEEKDSNQKREVDVPKEKERYHEKYMGKSIQELDLSKCERYNASYRRLPEDYPIPIPSQRSKLDAQVLNDHWVSVTSGSEDYSFKHMRKNQYEESLFRCEDDRFELDMLIESVSSTAKRVEEFYNSVLENKINIEGPVRIEEYLSVLHLRCIERIYGDYGLEAIEALRKNPTLALPVMLTRLKQKQKEWGRCRSDFNKVWAEIFAKNHNKSLDHRSFYFKQQDSKNLNPKSLVAEIKEIKEKQQKPDDLQAFVAGNKQSHFPPHIQFQYLDVGIHEDLYKLVRYSCKEVFASKELLNKSMRFWTTFLEPMLGVPSRSDGAVGVEERRNGHYVHVGCPIGDSVLMNYRQPKSDNNEADGRATELKKFHRICLAGGDKEIRSLDGDCLCKDDALMEKGQKNVDCNAEVSDFSKQFASVRQPDDDSVAKSQSGNVSMVERRDIAIPVALTKGAPIESNNHEKSAVHCKIEKEEGELSPSLNDDSDEDNNVGNGDANVQVTPNLELNLERSKYQSRSGEGDCPLEVGIHNDADVDDEDIENASEGGEDVSGSESAGHQFSQEEHEEEEDMEQDDIDDKAESEGEVERMCKARSAGNGLSLPLPERSLLSVKPLAKYVPPLLLEERKDSRVLYGNDDFYVLFRLHQILYERILSAKTNSMNTEMKRRVAKDANSPDPYSRFMNVLYNLLGGSADNTKFEDECRAIIGNQSYMLFSLDKLIHKLVKQLQAVATVEIDNELLQLFEYENSRKPRRLSHSVYHANAGVILPEENIYRLECSSDPSKLSIWLMDSVTEKRPVFTANIDPKFANYLHNDFLSVFPVKKEPHGIMLRRNKRKHGDLDEFPDLEGVKIINGLEYQIACNSSNIKYAMHTEDLFYRPRKKRKTWSETASSKQNKARVERFHRFFSL